jgi:hypothetical protein
MLLYNIIPRIEPANIDIIILYACLYPADFYIKLYVALVVISKNYKIIKRQKMWNENKQHGKTFLLLLLFINTY